MPVVTIYFDRLLSLLEKQVSKEEIVDRLPYLGLDLEEVAPDHVRVEYNPNRPDFSTDYGVARALKGFLGYEVGSPEYVLESGDVRVDVDTSVKDVRPYFVGSIIKDIHFDDETIRQMISMQEDLHEGIGRKRSKVAIGIHNLDVLKPPIKYTTGSPEFSFTPLGSERAMTMQEILDDTEIGEKYGWIVSRFKRYPLLLDSEDQVLSFPPVINGELTRVTTDTRNLFIDITATDLKTAENALAILVTALYDAGAKVEMIEVNYVDKTIVSPNLGPFKMSVETELVKRLLGIDLTDEDIVQYLGRSRISVVKDGGSLKALIPRYRFDIIHQVDLVEEIAIGYGLQNFTPTIPETSDSGRLHNKLAKIDIVREAMIGLGLSEVMNFSLVSQEVLYSKMNRRPDTELKVERPKTSEHEVLRDLLIPSLLNTLSGNIHQEYPQRIFEISKIFKTNLKTTIGLDEGYHLAAAIAHSRANYTEAKSYLTTLLKQTFSKEPQTAPTKIAYLTPGRTADIIVEKTKIGHIGEIHPQILENFQLRTPVTTFEIDLEPLL